MRQAHQTQAMNAWRPISEKPPYGQAVLVLHRARKACRFHSVVVGWWNGREWRREDSNYQHGAIYQPAGWMPLELPPPGAFLRYSWQCNPEEFK